jgi:hypothetical protein
LLLVFKFASLLLIVHAVNSSGGRLGVCSCIAALRGGRHSGIPAEIDGGALIAKPAIRYNSSELLD